MIGATVFAVKRFAVHDGPGIRTTLFLKGCPLRCVWCHNPEGLEAKSELAFFAERCANCGACGVSNCGAHRFDLLKHQFLREKCAGCGSCADACPTGALTHYGKSMSVEEAARVLLEDRAFYGTEGGVTLSGGECLLYPQFCEALLRDMKQKGIGTAVDTCGAVPWSSLNAVLPYTDLFLYDVKAIDPEVHMRCTGRDNKQILENLKRLSEAGASIEVRIPFVPDYNDQEIPKIADFLKDLKGLTAVRLLPYHNFSEAKYRALGRIGAMPERIPTQEELDAAKSILLRCGLLVY